MRNVLRAGTWKRLTCALTLAAATSFIAPAPGSAGPMPPSCGSNQQRWIHYYSDPAKLNPTCQDIINPCPGQVRTYFCRGSETPYYTYSCHSCGIN